MKKALLFLCCFATLGILGYLTRSWAGTGVCLAILIPYWLYKAYTLIYSKK
ncbi:hypothetical protein GMA11_06420 [Granulicatella sp. zg-ZJ]|uniref:hypothetical protein n=1 Tax=Granulicatella sp. zg-ZJ TaxID=2678504 RepID=UPI0013D4C0D2|nr:hypothetical protein [Granulicatella sp. zg-ZJ]MBS4749841.1 hypothetical protein [Carnobacteriaceae bacterium zg-ZUI78]NEW63027.1 hypothetical protein [Granulicatella sp. zg-ZJ]